MAKLNEFVKDMEVKTFKNIEDFDSIPVDIEVEEVEISKNNPAEGEEPTFKVFQAEIEGVTVRVPKSVLNSLKKQLQNKEFTSFKVVKEGTGLNTEYEVITL